MTRREPITAWCNWREIIASERVITPRHNAPLAPAHTWQPTPEMRRDKWAGGPQTLSSGMTADLQTGRRFLDVVPTEQAIKAIRAHTLHIEYDTISLEAIEWDDGRTLITARNSLIIGGPWLAIIDSITIPAELRGSDDVCSICKQPAHASETDDEDRCAKCVARVTP